MKPKRIVRREPAFDTASGYAYSIYVYNWWKGWQWETAFTDPDKAFNYIERKELLEP